MKEKKSKKRKEMLRKVVESKGVYIALLSLIVIVGVYVYARNMKLEMEKDYVAFDEEAWQEAVNESNIEVIDVDTEKKEEKPFSAEPKKENPEPEKETKGTAASPNTEKAVPVSAKADTEFSMIMPCEGQVAAECSLEELVFCSTTEDWRTHNGLDIAAAEGDPVKAAEKGIVSKVYEDEELGVVVVVEHTNGISSLYGNLQSLDFISAGKQVEKGDVIGGVGKPGTLEADSGSHLHFEVHANGEYKNPMDFVKK